MDTHGTATSGDGRGMPVSAAAAGREQDTVRATYRRRAGRYDLTANLYYLMGFREQAYRRRAVAALGLRPGDPVVEIGCGTGLNFGLLQEAVGPTGSILGIDLTDAMLEQARARVLRERWENVRLLQGDAAEQEIPQGVRGILSTFALSLLPQCAEVVRRGSASLARGGRWVVLDLQVPPRAPAWTVPLLLPLVRPFAVTREVIARRPWERIERAMRETLDEVTKEELYGGFAYVLAGRAGGA